MRCGETNIHIFVFTDLANYSNYKDNDTRVFANTRFISTVEHDIIMTSLCSTREIMKFGISKHALMFFCLLYKLLVIQYIHKLRLRIVGKAIIFTCEIVIYNLSCISSRNTYKALYFTSIQPRNRIQQIASSSRIANPNTCSISNIILV